MAIHCNNKELPITIAFNHNETTDKLITCIYPSNFYTKQDSMIELYEGLKTGIKFFSDSPDGFDEEARIEIHTSLYDTADTQVTLVYPLSPEPLIHWMYQNQETFPWRMGTYLMKIYYRGESYTVGFFVRPLYLSTDQVHTIHHYLESKVEGLIYDLVYSNQSMSDQEEETLTNWYYDYARYMMNHKESINYFLLLLEKQPLSNLIGTNEISRIPGKMDRRSIQWNFTNKGLSKNSGAGGQIYFYNRVKKEDFKHKANQWMKNILTKWSSDIHHVVGVISSSNSAIKKNLNVLHQQQIKLQERKIYLNYQREVAKTTKIDIRVQLSITEQDIQQHKKIAAQQEIWMFELRTIYSRIIRLLNNSFFTEVERGNIKPILKSNSYFQLNRIYENSKTVQKGSGNKKRYIKILKEFWQIYEYYCLFTVIDNLKKLGFTVNKGFESNFVDLYYQSTIPSDTLFVLESSKAVIHCWYDKYHGDKFAAEQSGELFFTGQEKKRPDIKLDLYEKQEDGSLLFRSCIIFDAKFRKFANMHNEDYATKTYHQLTSYYNFFYMGKNRKSTRGQVVQQVICLYGSEKNEAVKKVVEPLLYIKLFPVIQDNGEIENRGEKEILEELEEWLDDLVSEPLTTF